MAKHHKTPIGKTQTTKHNLVAALDVGSSRILAVIASVNCGHADILGASQQDAAGIKNGTVVDSGKAAEAIGRAMREAQQMSGCMVEHAFVTGGGYYVESTTSYGKHVICASMVSPTIINGNGALRVRNLLAAMQTGGIKVAGLVPQSLAAGRAVLTTQEKDEGVCLVSIGSGTTEVAIFKDGTLRHMGTIPLAGAEITSDIANFLKISFDNAEEIKLSCGAAFPLHVGASEACPSEVHGKSTIVSCRPLLRQTLAGLIQPRVEEIFFKVEDELSRSGYGHLIRHGVVLTGGTAAMPGMVELGEEIFHVLVRIGIPRCVGDADEIYISPQYAAVIGTLLEDRSFL